MKHSITLIIIFPLLLTSPLFRQFMITTNSSLVRHPPSKIPYSCKTNRLMLYFGSPKPLIGNFMKHILILLSVLLLSSPLFGNPKGEHTLYRWETSSGIQWREFGDKDIHPQYKGDVENGKPSGLGVITFPDGSKFVGEYKDGEKNGQGTFTFSWGGKYEGEYKDGKQNGQGVETYPSGSMYVGEWKDGRKHGQGTYTQYGSLLYPDGRKYVGKYKNGKEWNGTYYNNNGKKEYKLVNGEIE